MSAKRDPIAQVNAALDACETLQSFVEGGSVDLTDEFASGVLSFVETARDELHRLLGEEMRHERIDVEYETWRVTRDENGES